MAAFSKIAFPLLSALGFYVTYGLSIRNNTLDLVNKAVEAGTLPGTHFPIRTTFLGLPPVDNQLKVLLSFFWPVINGDNPDVALRSLRFAGQAAAAWMITMMEGRRKANEGTPASYVSTLGVFVQNATFAVSMPIYWLTHLLTSPTAASPPSASDLAIPTSDLIVLPATIALGYLLPSYLQCLQAPITVSSSTQQYLMVLWQFFPILTNSIFQPLLKRLYLKFGPPESSFTPATRRRILRLVYGLALTFCVVSQIGTMSLSLASSVAPSLFVPSARAALAPSRVWNLNQPLFSPHKVASLAEGVLTFLQMDELSGCASSLLWAVLLHRRAQGAEVSWRYWAALQAKVLGSIAIGGPFAPVVSLLWERDEIVLDRMGGEGRGKVE